LLPFNQLHNSQLKNFIGIQRNRQILKTLGTNLDLFSQIKVWEARLFCAVLANFMATASTGDFREELEDRFTATNYKRRDFDFKIKI
jgi:hypothetical protein